MKPVLALFCGLLLLLSCNDSKKDTHSATDEAMPLFKKLDSDKSGIAFRNSMIQTADFNFMNYMYIYTGAGVAAGDIDNDGLIDLYFVQMLALINFIKIRVT